MCVRGGVYMHTYLCVYVTTGIQAFKKIKSIMVYMPLKPFFINSGINESEKETNIFLCIKQIYQKKEVQGEKEYGFYR